MKKLHDLRSVLSDNALLSTMDCMRTKGGSGIRRPRSTAETTTGVVQDAGEAAQEAIGDLLP